MKKKLIAMLLTGIVAATPLCALAAPETMPDGTIFDAEYYAQQNPDVVAALGTDATVLYKHYTLCGKNEGRQPCAQTAAPVSNNGTIMTLADGTQFDPVYYAQNNPDVVAAFGTDANLLAKHYLQSGRAEGRKASSGSLSIATTVTGNMTLQQFYSEVEKRTPKIGIGHVHLDMYKDKNVVYDLMRHKSLSDSFSMWIKYRDTDERIAYVSWSWNDTWFEGGEPHYVHLTGNAYVVDNECAANRIYVQSGMDPYYNYGMGVLLPVNEAYFSKLTYEDCLALIDAAIALQDGDITYETFEGLSNAMQAKSGPYNIDLPYEVLTKQ